MSSKTNIQAVPTSNDRLRAAFAEHDRLNAISSDLMKKIERLAPLEAEVGMARADLQQILQADAEALHSWVSRDAKGAPPDVNAKAREEAGRKLAVAQTRLGAAVCVKNNLEQELVENNSRLTAHKQAVEAAMLDVLGEEALRSVQRMVAASAAYLESEANYQLVIQKLHSFSGSWGSDSPQTVSVGHWMKRIGDANVLPNEKRIEVAQRVREQTEQELQALLRGEDPVR